MSLMRSLFAALALVLPAAAAQADRVTVFAAASLKDAMDLITPAFEAESGHDVVVSLAGSSALARQINEGAPADVFISANSDWMNVLEANGKLAPDTRRALLGNSLVLIAHDAEVAPREITAETDIGALLGDGQLAMALVEAVPAGIYGKASLESLGLWEALVPRVAQADNVRAALALVATGEAPLGIVYATDAKAEPRVHVVGRFPDDSHPPIIYPAAAMPEPSEATMDFLDFLAGEKAAAIFAAKGFDVLGE